MPVFASQRTSGNAVFASRDVSAASPTAAITSQTVNGQSVTISGTTTASPTSGLASLTASANGAVSVGPASVNLGSGTFSVTFTGVAPGDYSAPTITITNAAGTATASGGSTIRILGATGILQV